MKVTISIVTVVYNGAKYIEPTIQSVISQTFKQYEYIIVDGASKDSTLEIVKKYETHFYKVLSEPDQGVYDAMNKGLKLATGEYVLFLNAGDELASNDTLKHIFEGASDDLLYGETIIMNEQKQILGTRTELTSRKLPKALKKSDFLNGQVVSHQSFIPKTSLCKPFDLKFECSSDIDWMLNIVSTCNSIRNVNLPVSKYLQGGISDTQLSKCWKERFVILIKHFGIFKTIISHISFVIRFIKIGKYATKQ